ncbi:unnamed protein product [Rotaria socialis]|uniref:Cerebral cavernous malformations 2 harmonin-homology domain-containing protein n=1 Tax=Rotaria socialis TaxID=392032 RepID=A0A820K5J2_9BILA|nr:unnamed protein product [Rotaria socialis]CAF4171113.1 unnamed protein product [Rotaria socialis]CAF4334565.1 unnamed protein product [Rotaria socialis]CAF4466462.1 unnamed protein product [Rotaria socialis]
MFLRAASLSAKTKQHKLDRLRPPSPWTNDLADEGVVVFVCAGTVDLAHDDDVDLSYKKKLLQFIAQCQIERRLPKRLAEKSIGQLHITTEQIKLFNTHQKLILSIPSHHIISCYYVEYEKDHIVTMKYVSTKDKPSNIELVIFLLNDRYEADELCSSMEFCFHAIYTANEQNSGISKKLSLLAGSLSSAQQLRCSFDSTTSSTPSTIRSLSLASTSSARVMSPDTSTIVDEDLLTPRRRHRRSRNRNEDKSPNRPSTKSTSHIIQNYLLNLQLELKTDELAEFGKLLTEWQLNHTSTKAFVKKTARLYGESRRNLLDGLHDFVPVDEQSWFLEYLNNLKSNSSSLSSSDDSLQDVDTF